MKLKAKKHSDLCSTCNEGISCNYSKSHEKPVMQCEEFSCASVPSDKEFKMNNKDNRGKCNHSNYKGLCANCENNKDCIMDKPEGGIWHCEEYR